MSPPIAAPSDVTLACATEVEERAGRRGGVRTALIGLAGCNGIPEGQLVSFGLAGALTGELLCGDVVDATRVVDAAGNTLWEGGPLGVAGARSGTILGADAVVDDPAERARLHVLTGALAADLESGPLARSGRLAGCVRVVSDTPSRRLHGICGAVTPGGRMDWTGFATGFLRAPVGFARAAADGRRALRVLEQAAEGLA